MALIMEKVLRICVSREGSQNVLSYLGNMVEVTVIGSNPPREFCPAFFESKAQRFKAAKARPHNGWRRGTAVCIIFTARVPWVGITP